MSEFEHMVMKVQEAANGGMGHLSTGEALAAALVLNRSDWLSKMGYTIAEAIDRIGRDWAALIPAVATAVGKASEALAQANKTASDETAVQSLAGCEPDEIDLRATLVTYGNAPGYRDVRLTFDVSRFGAATKHRLSFSVNAKDSESIARHIVEVNRVAWDGSSPIDIQPGEKRPRWIG